jgi:hypothetical protein
MSKRLRFALRGVVLTAALFLLLTLAASAALPAGPEGGRPVYDKAAGNMWYLAEGCTEGGMETWVLVQNPMDEDTEVSLSFMTGSGPVDGPQDVLLPANSRASFNVGSYVTDWDVSTSVNARDQVVCERAMYGNGRQWAHESIGTETPDNIWYLAEGCTGPGFETWVLVQNPGFNGIAVDLSFMTSTGEVPGPQGFSIPARSRRSIRVNDYVTDWDVSTVVDSLDNFVCERAMYGNDRAWAHDSIGVNVGSKKWYMAEGCTGPGFETWVLVQNPGFAEAAVNLTFMTPTGEVPGPQNFPVPGRSRRSFKVNDYVTDWDVSTRVTSADYIICERAMYDSERTWAHESIGSGTAEVVWYLAEGSTGPGFETWILVQNPMNSPSTVNVDFMTGSGQILGPQNYVLPAHSRASFNVGDYVTDYDVSTRVIATVGNVVCERSMYDTSRTWAHDSIGYGISPP